ncbi:MAG: FecR domain-containing protein [Deltaproteobacteria bacterium]|nr:FecR domain-containing protein [Deltaproteobacteria bacterium]
MVMLALLIAAGPAASTPAVAIHVVGDVQVKTDAQSVPLVRFAPVPEGATVITRAQSMATLRLGNGSLVRLGADTELALQELEQSEVPARSKSRLKVAFGRIWLKVNALFGDDASFEVATENAVAGVRGTSFWVMGDGKTARFVVDSGAVDVKSGGTLVDLRGPGSAVDLGAAGFGVLQQLDAATLAALRHATGGGAAVLVHELTHTRPRERGRRGLREALRRGVVGPEALADSAVRLPRRSDELRGVADVTVELRLK